jgi:HK97 family phage prohead protease
MVLRCNDGIFKRVERTAFLEYLGVSGNSGGKVEVGGDVVCAASVLFCLSAGGEASGDSNTVTGGVPAIPNGIAWTFSTFDLDRFDERIDPAGWDFSQYLKNPVIEWAHRYDIPAIGRAEGLYTDDKGLHGSVVFNDREYAPFGWAFGERVKAGVIRAGSVGFRVIEIEIPSKEDGKDGTALIFRKQELLEFSICNVPANSYALAKSVGKTTADATQGLSKPDFWRGIIKEI